LQITKFLDAGTIEEKIYQRQIAKEGLSRAVVDEEQSGTRHFRKDELRELFRTNDMSDGCDTHTAIKCACSGNAIAAAPR
jgi:hypothetical protein